MEETREKIELFRNYYFVCFRSFEQDPYSPTYLEPLNMYIIVFREGTLSVSSFLITIAMISDFFDVVVPFPWYASSAERSTSYQAAQGLHQRHFRLDFLCAHR